MLTLRKNLNRSELKMPEKRMRCRTARCRGLFNAIDWDEGPPVSVTIQGQEYGVIGLTETKILRRR